MPRSTKRPKPRSETRPAAVPSQDLLLMRIERALRAAKVPSRQIVIALAKIREELSAESSVSTPPVALSAENESRSSHAALPLIVDHRSPSVTALRRREASERKRLAAEQHFATALELEDSDVAAARAGYIAALSADNTHLEARINLGRLLHLNGELAEAEAVYRAARHASATLSFNLAILLEDLSREEEAVLAYREALALDPTLHDAHFNLSQLHERAQRPQEALRHLLAYRRQT
jgi:tetratricopeptide (TPR) repeat protein